ncbi:SulP family inorganic anion transporter [Hymenobacter psychrotolerans]|uniref:Sulfate permease, MFS superfamily n=1 Tax=Hymenobacter psychrotolerans DSM 18569 TaxID=1121959 RepID=A0A1M6W6B7_9BACT|nr:SulP family inorganic anion transporter [Hymenobacter psychrotolerans]SHK89332.1 Sulfate permease, MFS superfamily [Hymenobacter psychrotolerans DSM 18569]
MSKSAPAPPQKAALKQDPAPRSSVFSSLNKDVPAGLVVFLVALPLCLGISLASGAPLMAGLITGVVGGVLVSWLSGSQLSVSGPAAGLTAIIVMAIQTLGSFEAVLAATVIAGVLQIIMGVVRAGIIGLYFPTSVIRGMLAAIGLILILKQIPHLLGVDTDYFEDMSFLQFDGQNTFTALAGALQSFGWGSALIGLVSLGVLLLWENVLAKRVAVLRMIPAALIVVVLSIAMSALLDVALPTLRVRPEHLVQLPNISSWADFTGVFTSPKWEAFMLPATYTVAFTLAIVASLESLLSVEAVDKLDPQKRATPTNRELMAQGTGNIIAGLLGGLPMTAVIVRSSANINAGGQTRMSAFVHGLLLLTSLLFLDSILNRIPLSALAAVLLVVGYKLTKPALYRTQWKLGWQQFLPFIITIVAILLTDLLKGVTIGLVVGVFYILKTHYESAYFLRESPELQQAGVYHLKLSEHVSFLNKASIVRMLEQFSPGSRVILDGSESEMIDYDVLEAIENFRQSAADRGLELELRGIPQVEVMGH